MGVSDASILASEVDMTLQVIQYRRYPQPMNIRAKQLIEKVGGNLVGIVLNNINMSQDESYYYYSGYYHDYYSKNEEMEPAAKADGATADDGAKIDIKPKY
jgi:Mrp family chromosome partitioning ATPase